MKVKPRSALMAEERKSTESPAEESPGKRRARRSPTPGVRSPAYSDISDDAAPPDAPPDTDPAHRPFPVYHQVSYTFRTIIHGRLLEALRRAVPLMLNARHTTYAISIVYSLHLKEMLMIYCSFFQYYGQPSFMPPTHPPAAPPPSVEKNKEELSKGDPKTDLKVSYHIEAHIQSDS